MKKLTKEEMGWRINTHKQNPGTIIKCTDEGIFYLEKKVKRGFKKEDHNIKVWSPFSKEWTNWFLPHSDKGPKFGSDSKSIIIWSASNTYSVIDGNGRSLWKYSRQEREAA